MKTATTRVWTLLTLFSALLCTSKVLADAPAYVPIQGYLTNTQGEPVDGSTSVRFRLYSAEQGGTVLFDETKSDVNVEQGVFSVYLGDDKAIDLSVFRDHPVVFVGIQITGDSTEMSPRLQLATAPYAAFAQYCGDASTLDGKAASEFLASNYTPAWSSVTGKPSTFAPSAHGHAWSDITSGVPAGISDGDDDSLAGLSCTNGQVVKRTGGVWACGTDVDTDTNTTYSAGTGLSLIGTQFSADTNVVQRRVVGGGCSAGSYIQSIAADGTATCASASSFAGSATVAGTLTVGGLSYATAQQRTLWVGANGMQLSPAGLYPSSNEGGVVFGDAVTGTPYTLIDNVQLPDSAIITGYKCEVLDRSTNANFSAISTGLQIRASGAIGTTYPFKSEGDATAGNSTSVKTISVTGPATAVSDATVSIWISVTTSAVPSVWNSLVVYGCRVSYTVTAPS